MQAVYQAEVSGIEIDRSLSNLFENESFVPETIAFATELASATWDQRAKIDGIIEKLAIEWPLDRIGKVDRSILRIALCELIGKGSPPSVVINEAVELAKKYSSGEAAKFINGILGAWLKTSKDS